MGFAELRFLKDFKFTWTSSVNVDETRSTALPTLIMGNMPVRTACSINTIPEIWPIIINNY